MNNKDIQDAVRERKLANGSAPSNWFEARVCARSIRVPWFRAQALAKVAFHAPERDWLGGIGRSVASWSCDEPHKRVSVAAWPARAEIERTGEFSGKIMDDLISESHSIENTGSRVEALSMLWQGVSPLAPSKRASVETALIEAGLHCISWRGARCLRDLALTLDPADGFAIAERMPECRVRRQVFREIAQGKRYGVRSFV